MKLTGGSLSPGLSCPPRYFSVSMGFSSNSAGLNTQHPTKDANPERPSGAEGFLSFYSSSLTPFRMNTYRKQGEGGGYRIVSPSLLHPSAETRSTNPLFSTTCALFAHSFAQGGKSSAFFSMVYALFAKTWRVYPNYSLPRRLFPRGQIGPHFLPLRLPLPYVLSFLCGLCASAANLFFLFWPAAELTLALNRSTLEMTP